MGTTFCSIHIYSTESVDLKNYSFRCFSPGWQTLLMEDKGFSDPEDTQKLARKISKSIDAPVLWFFEFDSDSLQLKIYLQGKQAAYCSNDATTPNKNIFQMPKLLGYESGDKRRISKILACEDVDQQVELLEEFFGLCLLPFPELIDENAQELSRIRSDKLYQAHIAAEKACLAAEKKWLGKKAAVQAEPVQELVGELDGADWFGEWFDPKKTRYLPYFKAHYYLYSTAKVTGVPRVPVHFHNGEIQFISREEMKLNGADKPYSDRSIGENPDYAYAFEPDKLIFLDTAPEAYRGKGFLIPRGFCGLGFDAKARLVLYDFKKTCVIVDGNMKVIAKQEIKGKIKDFDGEFILTTEEKDGISDFIRVYRILDQEKEQ